MRIRSFLLVLTMMLGLVLAVNAQAPAGGGTQNPPMILSTSAFPDGGDIPVKYSQAAPGAKPGEGTSVPLTWTNPPAGTQSFLLHFHDMEAARNKTTDDQVHWLVWNIPATARGLSEGLPAGVQMADGSYQFSATGHVYRGPGAGANGPKHHYVLELFALDFKPTVKPGADAFETRTQLMREIQGHILGKAVYMGLFRRPN